VLLKCNACGRASSSGVGGSRAGVAWIASASGPAKPRAKGVDAAAKGRNMPVKCGSTAVAEAPPPLPVEAAADPAVNPTAAAVAAGYETAVVMAADGPPDEGSIDGSMTFDI
jgi:hypothetical protein